MLRFLCDTAVIAAATAFVVHKIEKQGVVIMGAVARELAGVKEQLDKIRDEVASAGELDDEDRAVLAAVKAGINAVDEIHPDATAPEPQPEPAPEPSPEPTEPA